MFVESALKSGTYIIVTARPPDSHDNRDLLASLDREQERIRDENEWMRLDVEVETFARRTEGVLRESLGGQIPGNTVRAVLPANADPLVPQEASRRVLFAQHLAEIAEGAVLDHAQLLSDPLGTEPLTSGRETLSAGVCAACRGSCCRSGGDHAYLTEETILRSLQAHPERTLAQIMDSYLECLPAETVQNSCIYHSGTGCGLPRALRSSTCNRYLCGKLMNLRTTLPENHPPPILAVMFDDGKWARTALIDETGLKILSEEFPREALGAEGAGSPSSCGTTGIC
jgi:hypothetical protein